MSIEDFIASIPRRYWTNPIRTVQSSNNGPFVNTIYLEAITVIEFPCCMSFSGAHTEDCEALKAVQSWKGRWS